MGDTYDPDLFCGESEWYWEEEVIGGSLCRITLDDENDPVWRFKVGRYSRGAGIHADHVE